MIPPKISGSASGTSRASVSTAVSSKTSRPRTTRPWLGPQRGRAPTLGKPAELNLYWLNDFVKDKR